MKRLGNVTGPTASNDVQKDWHTSQAGEYKTKNDYDIRIEELNAGVNCMLKRM
jgi:hypothetical protein